MFVLEANLNMKRNQSGGTLALVAVCAFVIVLIGVAVFFLSKLFGGGNELRHATDSGNLNVAKIAIRHPNIPVNTLTGIQKNNFSLLGDETKNPTELAGHPINLLSYNRAVGHTLLVALNADAQNNFPSSGSSPAAIAHKNLLKDALQKDDGSSLGATLRDALVAGTDVKERFQDPAQQNNVRMFGHMSGSGLSHVATGYRVAYIDRTEHPSEATTHMSQATNLVIPPSISGITGFIPAGMISQKHFKNGTNYNLIRGYHDEAGIGVIGVPVYPDDQPHLVSDREFSASQAEPLDSVAVPPNGFQSLANSTEQKSQVTTNATASAKVGSLNTIFPLNFKNGYIEAINGPAAVSVSGNFGMNTVIEDELGQGGGIDVSGPVFSNDPGVDGLNDWAKHNFAKDNPTNPGSGDHMGEPGTSGYYKTSNGSGAGASDLKNVPYKTTDGSPIDGTTNANNIEAVSVHCTDTMATSGGAPCENLYDGGQFHNAYPPEPGTGGGSQTANNLMAVECAKCMLQMAFNQENASIDLGEKCNGAPFPPGTSEEGKGTGLKIFSHVDGANLPSKAPSGNCHITSARNGTIQELFEQTHPGSFNELFGPEHGGSSLTLWNRINEMNPSVSEGLNYNTTKSFIANGPYGGSGGGFPMETVAYIYYDYSGSTPTLKFNFETPPGKLAGARETPDGPYYPQRYSTAPYGIVEGVDDGGPDIVNPPRDRGIHKIMYQSGPDHTNILAQDFAGWQTSSGFNNKLGQILFRQVATGSAGGFDDPD